MIPQTIGIAARTVNVSTGTVQDQDAHQLHSMASMHGARRETRDRHEWNAGTINVRRLR